jgi:hypothetical protein
MNRINKHFYNSLFIVQSQLSFICSNRIFDVIVRVLALGAVDHGWSPDRSNQTIHLVFVGSPLSMHH